jgi:hypothetical protein
MKLKHIIPIALLPINIASIWWITDKPTLLGSIAIASLLSTGLHLLIIVINHFNNKE